MEPVLPLHPKRPGGAEVEEVEGTSSGWCLTLRVVGLWVRARPGSVCAPAASLSFLRKEAGPVPAAAWRGFLFSSVALLPFLSLFTQSRDGLCDTFRSSSPRACCGVSVPKPLRPGSWDRDRGLRGRDGQN